MKKKLLIINRNQFGSHIDTYSYCKYARNLFVITYIGFDASRPKIEVEGVDCIYVSRRGNIIARYLRFLIACMKECRKNYDVIFIKYIIGCVLFKMFCRGKTFVFDIRTASVSSNQLLRKASDLLLRFESMFFENVTVISKSLADKLCLSNDNYHILPLGAEPVDAWPKEFNSLKLLYVGTFNGRRIEDTVEGFARFYAEFKDKIKITYDIIGDGDHGELNELRRLVEKKGLSDVINLPGYIHQNLLIDYYRRCNLGVSYIPINEIYDCQPPTKTYEYLLAGMPVLATKTIENSFVINEGNGVMIEDSADSFYDGLRSFFLHKDTKYDSVAIKNAALQFSWQRIVEDSFIPYIVSIA